jgi:hypothetical protein
MYIYEARWETIVDILIKKGYYFLLEITALYHTACDSRSAVTRMYLIFYLMVVIIYTTAALPGP